MSGNSLASLLELMKNGSVTQGWGAVSTFNRGRLNRLLEQQYIDRFNGLSFLPPFSGRLVASDDKNDYVELENISFGAPLLSFNSASLNDSTAILTMNIITGRYTASRQPPGAEKVVLSTFNITESQGFTLEMDIDLSLVVGEVDRQGKVTLNLSKAANFRCNLAGTDDEVNEYLALYFKQSFEALPPHRSVFQLGMLDLKGYNHLTPKSFRILTQAAPGAKVRGALNYGDGGVVVLIQLLGNTGPGQFPPTNLPYFIPDDQGPDGSDQYSATLVLSEEMVAYVEDNRLELLNNLLFPGEHVFEERERHAPRDLAVFGNISPKQTLITLEPAFKTIKAGDTQRFTLHNSKGEVIQASNWRAVSLRSHTVEGHGTITDGLYTAASSLDIGHDSLHVVVTAEYVNADITYSASALLLVVFDSMTIAPRVATCPTTAQSQPVVLTVSTVGDDPVNWTLLGPEYGTLSPNGSQGLFTANARAKAKGLAVQQIEVTGTERRQACLLLMNAQQLLRVNPPYVSGVRQSTEVQLKDDPTLLPGVPRRWKVIGGGGTVDASGLFAAPAQGSTASSVVQCEIVRNGVVFSSGYGVIDLSELEPEPGWELLSQFTIKVPNGPDLGRLGTLYTNGYQQLRAEITVETTLNNQQGYPLSVTEKASMKLVDSVSHAEIEFVDDALDGIPEEDEQTWRTRLIPNRFDLAMPGATAQDSPLSADPSAPAPISVQHIYIHTREKSGSSRTFYATFQADRDAKWWKSTDQTDNNKEIAITPQAIPNFVDGDYTFERVRVDGGSGAPGGGGEEGDDFDFHLRTVDYWTFTYAGRPGAEGAAFETMEFLSVDGDEINTSSIRWESEQLRETMFSWTGSIFTPKGGPSIKKIYFDESVKDIMQTASLDIDVDQTRYTEGTFVISLHRRDDVEYVRAEVPSRAKLSRPLKLRFIDKRGNPHVRLFDFLPASDAEDRNYLKHVGV